MSKKLAITGQAGNELNLWIEFCRGDRDAFAAIYNLFAVPLFSYGYRICNNESIVKDTIQDFFVELWWSKEKLHNVQNIKSYLFKSLRYKLVRLGKVNILYTADENIDSFLGNEESIETTILNRETSAEITGKIHSAIQNLSLRQREAIALKYYYGFTNDQIAVIMGVNYQSATNILHRAILILRQHFIPALTTILPAFFYGERFF